MATDRPGLPLAVFVADCVPVYIFDPVRRAAALVHAGRAGTQQNITGAALAVLRRAYGTNPSDVHIHIGPSAGPCCYEVSVELARAFRGAGLPASGRRLDLWGANRLQAEAAGVPRAQVACSGICTICDGRFYSYRRGDGLSRNMALLML